MIITHQHGLAGYEREFQRARRRQLVQLVAGALIFAGVVVFSAQVSDFSPGRVWQALPRMGDYLVKTLPEISLTSFFTDIAYWYYGFFRWFKLLFDTFLIALIATLFGAFCGFLLCFTASHNLVKSYLLCFAARRIAEFARTVPEIVYALIFVIAFGVGPMAGLFAIMLHSTGALTKLFSEVNENIDEKPLEGIRAAGANWFEVIRYGVVPQVLPNYLTYTLWRLELNIRSAAIIGFVGAGGIGQELYKAISMSYYEDISAIVLMIVFTVALIDLVCERFRHSIIGRENLVA